MEKFEKFGYAIFLLLILIVITPKISQSLTGSTISVGGVSLNDFILLIVLIIAIVGLFWVFYGAKPDFSTSKKSFRKLYKPESDLDRVRQYIKEQIEEGVSKQVIMHSLARVGWSDDIIDTAFETADKAKLIKLKPFKFRKKKHVKKRR